MVDILLIEGGSSTRNGNLREGFYRLLRKEIPEEKMPWIVMGNGKKEAVKKFRALSQNNKGLLIDLDAPESKRDKDLSDNHIGELKVYVFYMIQEMEAWFLSQPQLLENFYKDIDWKDLYDIEASQIARPSTILQEKTRYSNRRKYHKIKHAVELLPMLNTKKLSADFIDFQRLISTLKN